MRAKWKSWSMGGWWLCDWRGFVRIILSDWTLCLLSVSLWASELLLTLHMASLSSVSSLSHSLSSAPVSGYFGLCSVWSGLKLRWGCESFLIHQSPQRQTEVWILRIIFHHAESDEWACGRHRGSMHPAAGCAPFSALASLQPERLEGHADCVSLTWPGCSAADGFSVEGVI